MNKFFVIPNILKSESYRLTCEIVGWLSSHHYEVFVTEDVGNLYGLESFITDKHDAMSKSECAIVLGGDGTILSVARETAPYNLPILGVNLGRLGFLAEVDSKDVLTTLVEVCAGRYFTESRMMLQTKIIEDGKISNLGLALNDVVATRGAISRMVGYSVYVNDELVNTFYADGIIVSTPTGSTAYNLSAGGPILGPCNEMMVITPICPHSLTARSLVISSKDMVRINFGHNLKSVDKDLQVTIDGQHVIPITNESEIFVEQSTVFTRLIKLNRIDFYTLLRKKLGSN